MNSIVVTLEHTIAELKQLGHDMDIVTRRGLSHAARAELPRDPARATTGISTKYVERLERFDPDAVHLPTEGPLGIATQRHCSCR